MVGCDNPACLVEWYHFECVQLTREVRLARCLVSNVAHLGGVGIPVSLAGRSLGLPGM
jgi:hypothetical protein